MTKQIPLTQGKVALVDDDVYEWASRYKWQVQPHRNTFYARRNGGVWPFSKTIRLHREIMSAPAGVQVDHINGDGLDCRRVNLRLCTHAENQHNGRIRTDNTSGYRGVYLHKASRKWDARIKVNGKVLFLGHFTSPEAAARAYDEAAKKHHGEFASLNFE